MTQQFDEGVKEILMTLLSLGATMYETDYVLDQLKKRPEPIEQKIQAIKLADDRIDNVKFDRVSKQVINQLKVAPTKVVVKKPVLADEPSIEEQPAKSSMEIKEDKAFNMLRRGGLTPIAVAGILANLKAESEMNPAKLQEISLSPVKYGKGRGLAQWEKGGRYDTDRINLVKFARDRGKDWRDFDTQIGFILHEMEVHSEYKRVKAMLNNAKTVDEAVRIFLTKYEKAGKPHYAKRLKYGKEYAKKYIKRVI